MKNFTGFLCVILSIVSCSAKSFMPPCSPRPDGLDVMVQKCFKEHVDMAAFNEYVDDADANNPSLNNFKACTLRELGLLFGGRIVFSKVEALINEWINNEESAKNINKYLETAVEEANKEHGESAIAHKFFVIVNKEEERASFITSEFC